MKTYNEVKEDCPNKGMCSESGPCLACYCKMHACEKCGKELTILPDDVFLGRVGKNCDCKNN